jgi:CBS domain containing-hemolysin-like protein
MSPSTNALLVVLALALVLLNGFFVAAEFSMVKLRHTRVEALQRMHGLRGRVLMRVHERLDVYLSACQLGITLASLGLGWVGEPAFATLLETPLSHLGLEDDPQRVHTIAFVLAFAVISYLHIVIGELAPKSAAIRRPEAISLWTALPLYLFHGVMFPFIWILNASANAVLRFAGLAFAGGSQAMETPYSHEELRVILHSRRAAPDSSDEEISRVLAHALELRRLHASDVMRPRHELATLSSDASHAEVRRILQTLRYSRYPCVDADSGEIRGVLHLKDLFLERAGDDFTNRLHRAIRLVERVHEDEPLSSLLRRFRLGAPHLALVHDDDGTDVGFVTMEDVFEAVFGRITDEHEAGRAAQGTREPQRLEDGTILARGDTPLFLLERLLGETFAHAEALNTMTGLLMDRLGHLPQAGSVVRFGAYTATVVRIEGRTVGSVLIAAARD